MKKKLIISFIAVALLGFGTSVAASVLQGFQGGTGYGSATSSNVGQALIVSSTSPYLIYTFGNAGGGSGSSTTVFGISPIVVSGLVGGNQTTSCPTCYLTSNPSGYITTSTNLTTANFATTSISQWNNNAGYITTSTNNFGGITSYSRAVTKTVCASNALDTTNCDYKATGTNDNVTIQNAINSVSSTGGTVYLSEGTFNMNTATSVKMFNNNVALTGSVMGATNFTSAGTSTPMIQIGTRQTGGSLLTNVSLKNINFSMGSSNSSVPAVKVDGMGNGSSIVNVTTNYGGYGLTLEDLDRVLIQNVIVNNPYIAAFEPVIGLENTWGNVIFYEDTAALSNASTSAWSFDVDSDQSSPQPYARVTLLNDALHSNNGVASTTGLVLNNTARAFTIENSLFESNTWQINLRTEDHMEFIGNQLINNNAFSSTSSIDCVQMSNNGGGNPQITWQDNTMSNCVNGFHSISGAYPTISFEGLNKNDSNITNMIVGSYSYLAGTDVNFLPIGTLTSALSTAPYSNVFSQNVIVGSTTASTINGITYESGGNSGSTYGIQVGSGGSSNTNNIQLYNLYADTGEINVINQGGGGVHLIGYGDSYISPRSGGFAVGTTTTNGTGVGTFYSQATSTFNGNIATNITANSFVATNGSGILIATGTPSGGGGGSGTISQSTSTYVAFYTASTTVGGGAFLTASSTNAGTTEGSSGAFFLNLSSSTGYGLNIYNQQGGAPNDQFRIYDAPNFNTTVNGAQTLTNTSTVLTVNSTAGFPSTGYIEIQNQTGRGENSYSALLKYTTTTATTFAGTAGAFYNSGLSMNAINNALIYSINSSANSYLEHLTDYSDQYANAKIKIFSPHVDMEFAAQGYNAPIGQGQFAQDVPIAEQTSNLPNQSIWRFNGRNTANSGFNPMFFYTGPGTTNEGKVCVGGGSVSDCPGKFSILNTGKYSEDSSTIAAQPILFLEATSTQTADYIDLTTSTVANAGFKIDASYNVSTTANLSVGGNIAGSDGIGHSVQSLASSSISFGFAPSTTTIPYNFEPFKIPTKWNITSIECADQAATSTMSFGYATTLAHAGAGTFDQTVLATTTCGVAGTTITSGFSTTTIPMGDYFIAEVTSTAGSVTGVIGNAVGTKL